MRNKHGKRTSTIEVEARRSPNEEDDEEGDLDPVGSRVLGAARLVEGELFREDVVAPEVEEDARLDLADALRKVNAVLRLLVEAHDELVEDARDGEGGPFALSMLSAVQ